MSRPSVLVFEPDPERRKLLAAGIAALGSEVVPAVDAAEARRFVEELDLGVVMAPARLAGSGDGSLLAAFLALGAAGPGGSRRTLLLLGDREEEGALPDDVIFLADSGLAPAEVLRRVKLVLLGREVGIEPDAALSALVGDLALQPWAELLPALARAGLTGHLVVPGGEIRLADGAVVAADAGAAHGRKAFCRLAALESGAFHLYCDDAPGARQLDDDLDTLLRAAADDRVRDAPPPRSRLRLEVGPDFFHTRIPARQQALLSAVPTCRTVEALLDALPGTDGEILRDLLGLAELGIVVVEPPRTAVAVVTDSTADLPPEVARAHGIRVVPLLVLFGDRVYHDGLDLKPREFYDQLERGREPPRTSPPLKGDFLDAYRALAGRQDVLSLHLSGRMSDTVAHARAAADFGAGELARMREEGERPFSLRVLDSGQVSLGLGLLALFAARMAARRADLDTIALRLESIKRRLHVFFAVDSLDALARGGRIDRARAAFGKVLGIKPILGVVDGEVTEVDRVRGGRAAHPRLLELLGQRVDPTRPVMVAIAHAKAPVWADRLHGLLRQGLVVAESLVAEMGPTVGTHVGPGAVGVAVFQPEEEERHAISPLEPSSGLFDTGEIQVARDV